MAIKMDMAKAYDMVEWDVIEVVMTAHGFSSAFIKLVAECISSAHLSVLINRFPCGFFQVTRGIHQGDPISAAMFSILVNLLSRI